MTPTPASLAVKVKGGTPLACGGGGAQSHFPASLASRQLGLGCTGEAGCWPGHLLLGGLSKQLSQPVARGGGSKTFAVWSWGSREASCEEEKCKTFQKFRDTDPRRRASPRGCTCVRASGGQLCFGIFYVLITPPMSMLWQKLVSKYIAAGVSRLRASGPWL